MPTLETSARNGAIDGVVDLIDTGGTGALQIFTTGKGTKLAELAMSATAWGAASGAVATANAISDDTSADATGTAAEYDFVDGADAVVWSGTVGTSGAELNLNTVGITAGDTVAVSQFTVTIPAS